MNYFNNVAQYPISLIIPSNFADIDCKIYYQQNVLIIQKRSNKYVNLRSTTQSTDVSQCAGTFFYGNKNFFTIEQSPHKCYNYQVWKTLKKFLKNILKYMSTF